MFWRPLKKRYENLGPHFFSSSGSCGRVTKFLAELSAIWKDLQLAWNHVTTTFEVFFLNVMNKWVIFVKR